MTTYAGDFRTPVGRFALVAARFNGLIVKQLLEGARDGLVRHGVAEDAMDVVYVPGSLEIPLVAQRLAQSGAYAAVIALGAVIRGETSHYDIVAGESARGLARIALEIGVPVINAILTCENVEQAVNRAGVKMGNKGYEAAVAAIEMINLLASLPPTVAGAKP